MQHVLYTHRYKILAGVPIIILVASTMGFATSFDSMSFSPEEKYLAEGATTSVSVVVEATAPANVIGGSILLPDTLDVLSIDTSSSIVDLWTVEPMQSNTKIIQFGGGIISQSGFTGEGEIFSFVVQANATGDAEILFENPQILAHDGNGTNIIDRNVPLRFVIREDGQPSPDINHDNKVNVLDIGLISKKLFGAYDLSYDMNLDGVITIGDILFLIRRLSIY